MWHGTSLHKLLNFWQLGPSAKLSLPYGHTRCSLLTTVSKSQSFSWRDAYLFATCTIFWLMAFTQFFVEFLKVVARCLSPLHPFAMCRVPIFVNVVKLLAASCVLQLFVHLLVVCFTVCLFSISRMSVLFGELMSIFYIISLLNVCSMWKRHTVLSEQGSTDFRTFLSGKSLSVMTFVSQVDAHFVLNLENSACTVASSWPAYKTAIIALSPL